MVYQWQPSEALAYRKRYRGVIGIESKIAIKDRSVLSLVYTPGVAEPCLEIAKNPSASFVYTIRGNTIALVTDGSAVLGLGNVGPEAALAVMEGKAALFKTFAGVDAFPICLNTQDTDEIVRVLTNLSTTFGAICLEDVSSPRCFAIESHLQRALNIPVFHNDQHGTAVVVLAALNNAMKIVNKKPEAIKVVINGAGAAGLAVAKMLVSVGYKNTIVCDKAGAIFKYRPERMNWAKWEVARLTNPHQVEGNLEKVLEGADVFIGLSQGGVLTPEMLGKMAENSIVFALAEPAPEIDYVTAKKAGARIVATGKPDHPNEINIALAFPGIFRGALDVSALDINETMMIAAADAISELLDPNELNEEMIIPNMMDFRVAPGVARAVAEAAIETGHARYPRDPAVIEQEAIRYIYEGKRPVPPRTKPSTVFNGGSRPTADALREESLDLHKRYQGVLTIKNKMPVRDRYVLSNFYLPPGYSEAIHEIRRDPSKLFDYTIKSNLIAIVTDGSAVLGLGNIGARAALPVMEGKAILVNTFAGVEAFPICLATQDVDEIVEAVTAISTTFGGINLEDIAAPRCFEVERRLKEKLDIPVMHDDQHATAIVVLSGLMNALKLTGRDPENTRIVINGVGAAGVAVARLLMRFGIGDITLVDRLGIIYEGGDTALNDVHRELATITNKAGLKGSLADALKGADGFIGLSKPKLVTVEMAQTMASDSIIFALANPMPEIMPDEAKAAGVRVIATGRSDFDNQVNNSLAFPGIFRGALDVRARQINEAMKLAAAYAIAGCVRPEELEAGSIIPKGMDFSVPPAVAAAVAKAAIESGEARKQISPEAIARSTSDFIYEGVLTPLE
jgi:malate dehydrogenase (oxaloacetate-decarboxylating)